MNNTRLKQILNIIDQSSLGSGSSINSLDLIEISLIV